MNLRGVPQRIRLDPESAQPEAKVAGHREILATVMRSRTDLQVHSPKFNLHAGPPQIRHDLGSTQPASRRSEVLSTVMRIRTDLHVHSPKK